MTTATLCEEIRNLPRDVQDYFGIDAERYTDGLTRGRSGLAQLWREHKGTEAEFYLREDVGAAYIFDLAFWHTQGYMRAELDKLTVYQDKGMRALDYGSGIGTAALILAKGNRVDCIEPNPVLREFTQYRAASLDRDVCFLEQPEGIVELAVCTDVLEHVAAPERIAAQIVAALAPDGLLFTMSHFGDADTHPMHHIDADINGLHFWQGLGMTQLSDFWWRK